MRAWRCIVRRSHLRFSGSVFHISPFGSFAFPLVARLPRLSRCSWRQESGLLPLSARMFSSSHHPRVIVAEDLLQLLEQTSGDVQIIDVRDEVCVATQPLAFVFRFLRLLLIADSIGSWCFIQDHRGGHIKVCLHSTTFPFLTCPCAHAGDAGITSCSISSLFQSCL